MTIKFSRQIKCRNIRRSLDDCFAHLWPCIWPNRSQPFCDENMALLKLSGLAYTTNVFAGGFNLGPTDKRPFIVDEGMTVADSTLIRFYLEQKYGFDFDAHLTTQQKGVTSAVEKICEKHLHFAAVYSRSMVDENFNKGPVTLFN